MPKLKELLERIQSSDQNVRGDAWQNAGTAGPRAIAPLADLMSHEDFEVARAAKRAMWKIVRHTGRPGAESERPPVSRELIALLAKGRPRAVRVEAAWMLSEIAGDEAVAPLAALLKEREVREDARMALQRLPGRKSIAALQAAFESAAESFRGPLALSLRARGVKVAGVPCRKLIPCKPTSVKRLAAR